MSLLFPQLPDGPVADFDPELLEATVEELIAVLEEQDGGRRLAAAALLAAHGNDAGREILREGVEEDASTYVALEALRWLEDDHCLPWARDVLGRRLLSPFVQAQAAALLIAVGEGADRERGTAHLLERARNRTRDDDRGLVVELLGEVGVEAALEELEKTAAAVADPFCGAALKALARLDPEGVRERLSALARDGAADTDLRCDAVEALSILDDEAARAVLLEVAGGDDIVADLAQGLVED
ncbi:MAG: hypothetical protein P1V51_20945 [Deltaproteobacteria bacterium]|nr:hypothetical protein [Deltaproteobacteria bacterium]